MIFIFWYLYLKAVPSSYVRAACILFLASPVWQRGEVVPMIASCLRRLRLNSWLTLETFSLAGCAEGSCCVVRWPVEQIPRQELQAASASWAWDPQPAAGSWAFSRMATRKWFLSTTSMGLGASSSPELPRFFRWECKPSWHLSEGPGDLCPDSWPTKYEMICCFNLLSLWWFVTQ